MLDSEGVVLEVQALHIGVGRDGVEALFPACAKKLQGRAPMHLGVVEAGDGRGRGDVAVCHAHGIVEAHGNRSVAHDVLVDLHVHEPVFFQGVEHAGLLLAWLKPAQGFRQGHLVDQDLVFPQGFFRDAVPCLDEGGL